MARIPVKFFMSSDVGAPELKGGVGELRAILDACLLSGFNVKPVRAISRTGVVVRLSLDGGHGFKFPHVIKLDGVLPNSAVGEYRVTNSGVDWLEFESVSEVNFQLGATVRRAPLNWLRGFGTGDKVSYVSAQADSSGAHLVVDDTNTDINSTKGNWKAKVTAFERMTDISIGDNKITDGYWIKGISLTTTPAAWAVFGDEYMIYVFINGHTNQSLNAYSAGVFGDLIRGQYSAKKICVANSAVYFIDRPSYDYLGTNPRFFSYRVASGVSRGFDDASVVGVAAAASRLIELPSGRFGFGGDPICMDDIMKRDSKLIGRSAGVSILASESPPIFTLLDNRYFCMPCIADTELDSSSSGISSSLIGSVLFDVIGPWR